MAKAKDDKKDKAPFLSRVKDKCIDGIQSTLAFNHLLLKYSTDGIENFEAWVLKRAYAVDTEDTIKYRQMASIKKQMQIKHQIRDMKKYVATWTDIDLKGKDAVANETEVFNQ